MCIKDFDIEEFTRHLTKQAFNAVPSDLNEEQKRYIINTIYQFCVLAGNQLNEKSKLNLNSAQAKTIVQLVEEWTFHKAINLVRVEISEEITHSVLSEVAFAVFKKATYCVFLKMSEQRAAELIEKEVNIIYEKKLKVLVDSGEIEKDKFTEALSYSNINKMSEEPLKLSSKKPKGFFCKLVAYSIKIIINLVFRIILCSIALMLFIGITYLCIFLYYHRLVGSGVMGLVIALIVGLVILTRLIEKDVNKQLEKLEKVKQEMRDLVNPDKMLPRLETDILQLHIGKDLITIADPEIEGQLLAKTAALRQRLTDNLGFILPNIRIMDDNTLKKEYSISVRNVIVASGKVYPDKVMVKVSEFEKNNESLPNNPVEDIDPISGDKVYWLDSISIKNKNLITTDPADIIISHIQKCCIQYVDEIITLEHTLKLINFVKQKNPFYVESLTPSLISEIDLRKVLVNLVKEQVSIRDIVFIFERLCDYARFSKDPDILSEQLRKDLAKQICSHYADTNNTIKAIVLPDEWNNLLEKNCINGKEISINETKIQDLVGFIKEILNEAKAVIDKEPVILCSSSIRLVLYRLLSKYIPEIAVISDREVSELFKLDVINAQSADSSNYS